MQLLVEIFKDLFSVAVNGLQSPRLSEVGPQIINLHARYHNQRIYSVLEGGSDGSFSQQTRLGKNIELADFQVAKASDFYNNFDVILVCQAEQKFIWQRPHCTAVLSVALQYLPLNSSA